MNELWHPLSRREAPDGPQLCTVISKTLERALRDWIRNVIDTRHLDDERLILRCDLEEAAQGTDELDGAERVAYLTSRDKLWDLVDAVLDLALPSFPDRGDKPNILDTFARQTWLMEVRTPLARILDDAGSVYTVRRDGSAIEHRTNSTVTALLDDAVSAADQPNRGSASRHLLQARNAAYARIPDPVKAYSEAIKAVEAAAHTTLEPNNSKATLGTMLHKIPTFREKLAVPITGKNGTEGIELIESLIATLWTGQTSRHGNCQVTRDETPPEALEAVHIAALLVQLFSSGAIHRSS